jgi:hypothetical protein
MAPKRGSKSEETPTPPQEHFWDDSASMDEHRQKVSEHIARLQQRQIELVQQTTSELEELRQHLDTGKALEEQLQRARQPLLSEITALRTKLSEAETERSALLVELTRVQTDYQAHYAQMQGALASLKNIIRSQAHAFDQQVRVFSLDATQTLESMLHSVDAAVVPLPDRPKFSTAPTAAPQAELRAHTMDDLLREFPLPQASESRPSPALAHTVHATPKVKRARKPIRIPVKKIAVRTIAAGIIVGIGWNGLQFVQKYNAGDVAGATTIAKSESVASLVGDNPAEKYKESYTIIPFDQTEWETLTDSEFGFSIRYPKNTSNRVKTIGGNNVWFLRFDSFLMKITREETQDTLEQWWEKSRGFYELDSTVTRGTFKGRPAWVVTPKIQDRNSGTSYIFAVKSGVMQVWVKDEDPETDDGKRVARMLESFTISNQ